MKQVSIGVIGCGVMGAGHTKIAEQKARFNCEWFTWEPYETHLPRELSTMKQYEQEILRGEQ